MIEIRILDEKKDAGLLKEAWSWANTAPRWFKESQSAHKETLKSFLATAKEELLIGVFVETEPSAVVRFVPQKGVHELHLMAKRKTDFKLLLEACASIRDFVREKGLTNLGGWVSKRNRPIIKLYETLGFKHFGHTRCEGEIYGKPNVWLFYEIS